MLWSHILIRSMWLFSDFIVASVNVSYLVSPPMNGNREDDILVLYATFIEVGVSTSSCQGSLESLVDSTHRQHLLLF